MADEADPPAKRQKVHGESLLGSTYIPIATTSVPVHLLESSGGDFAAIHLLRGPLEIRYASIDGQEDAQDNVTVSVLPCKEHPSNAVLLHVGSAATAWAVQILENAGKLDPPWKNGNDPFKAPLACSSARLESIREEGPQQDHLILHVDLLWRDSLYPRDRIDQALHNMLAWYLPVNDMQMTAYGEEWDPRQFYENVHVPEKSATNSADIPIDLVQSKLFPFQRRAVRWLLRREGMAVQSSGRLTPIDESKSNECLPLGFTQQTDANGCTCYVNHTLGIVTSHLARLQNAYGPVKGGILAEEMGLGKTVELLALICLHSRKFVPNQQLDTKEGQRVSAATLIITPPTILEQWKQEIREHAPSLKVYHYEGLKSKSNRKSGFEDEFTSNDIVLTTYNVISKEVHYVADRPDRSLRNRPRYEPPKSPLTQINWWRVCLDEAQMVESGVSAAATVARLIPRVNAWAVSGTPLKRAHKDLFGLLLFLRYEPWCQSIRMWNRLVEFHRQLFKRLISEVAIRHTKEFVREDLRLPPQTRHIITLPFTAIEEQYYSQLFHQMCEDCGLEKNGSPTSHDWDPDSPSVVEKMRNWLTRLRQTCLHPEVGGRNRRALGRSGGPLRSVQQVLDVMIDQNDNAVRLEQRAILFQQIRRGQMMENAKNTDAAMDIWKRAYEESCKIVDECRAQLEAEQALRKETTKDIDMSSDEDEPENDANLTSLRQRLRSALEIKHICIFFIANAYFQLKSNEDKVKPESEEFNELQKLEEMAYDEAKSIRGELLSEVLKKVNRLIINIRRKAENNEFTSLPTMDLPLDYTGIESRKVFEKLDRYCQALNEQANAFLQLRQKMIEFLRQSLIDEDESVELQGDEYESSTKHQDEMYAYMEALRALFADRTDVLSGQENTLIRHEMKLLLQAAKAGEGPAPELLLKLLAEREACRVPAELGSLRGIITEIRHLITALQWQEGSARARAELVIATNILQHAQKLMAAQTKSISALEQEVNQFRDTMNSRLDYYRALQKISDTVAPFEEEKIGQPVDMIAYQKVLDEETKRGEKLAILLSKRRYLEHLKQESSSSASPRICTICQCDFEVGTLTVCGHQFCKECIQLWYASHKSCPVCKRHLRSQDFWDITYKPAEMAIQEESPVSFPGSPDSDRSQNKSIYSDISTATLNQIKDIDLDGSSFGSKVDTMCRHLLWLRDHDAGSKAIIFSQYRDFLDVLSRAFKQYRIGHTRFDDKNGIETFKNDPSVECFLLHAKAHATGLNLVVANHVFLCEPLINTAIELQAIARVHRIGQHRATTVWMYLVAETVEESIYEISVTRRLAHVKGKAKAGSSRSGTTTPNAIMENAIEAANSLELQTADLSKLLTTGKTGGEFVDKEDLWQCLFRKANGKESGLQPASALPADGEVGRFLRADAAEYRRTLPSR